MIRKKLTEAQFQRIKPSLKLSDTFGMSFVDKHGQVNLLISGEIDTCTGLADQTKEYRIVGATVNYTTYTLDGTTVNNRDTLKQCTQFSILLPNLETGERDYYLVDILGKKVYTDYIYLRCNTEISASNISFGENSVIKVDLGPGKTWTLDDCFRDDSSDTTTSPGRALYDYTAYLPELVDLQYFPYYSSDYFKDDYNPLVNNASASRQNSSTVNVGLLANSNGFFNRSDMGKAEMSDYWYTSLGIGLGRYLGAKCTRNLVCDPYIGFKSAFSNNYLSASKANFSQETDIRTGKVTTKHKSVDRPFYTVQSFSGSVFMSGSVAEVTSSIRASDSTLEELKFAADSAYAEITGSRGQVEKAWEDVKKIQAIPKVGDVLYRFDETEGTRYRLTDCMVFVPEAGQLLCTDNYGVVYTDYEVE